MAVSGEAFGENYPGTYTNQPPQPGEPGYGDGRPVHLSEEVYPDAADVRTYIIPTPVAHPKGPNTVTPQEELASLVEQKRRLLAAATIRAGRMAVAGFSGLADGTLNRAGGQAAIIGRRIEGLTDIA